LGGTGVTALAAIPFLGSTVPAPVPVGIAVGTLLSMAWAARARRGASEAPEAAPAPVEEPQAPQARAQSQESRLLANLSHEIRTPLNGVVTTAHLLEQTPLDEEQQALVRTLATSGNNLLDLINDILDLSKVEAGEVRLESREFSVQELVGELCRLFAAQAHSKNLVVVADLDPSLPETILGDPTRLRQVLSNLLSNAIKFTKKGHVALRVDRSEVGLRFAVEDTGIGIPKDAQERIFQSYQQADSATPRMFGGTGLGLAICKELSSLMGGQLTVTSAQGEGSCFSFSVPMAELGRAEPAPMDLGRALIVHSSKAARAAAARTLEARGVDVEQACDGLEGLQLALHAAELEQPFSVVVVEEDMPGVSGTMVTRMFRREPELEGVRVLIASPRSRRPQATDLASLQMEPLEAPILPGALVEALERPAGAPAAAPAPRAAPAAHRQRSKSSLGTSAPLGLAATLNKADDTAAEGNGPRVLLVDDNGFNQMLIQMQLRKLGCSVRVAANGLAGVNAWQSERFDLVLMDLQMPEMNGFEATFEIRRRESESGCAPTPIVAVTAEVSSETRQRCLESGMDDYLTKPVALDKLRPLLDKLTGAAPEDGAHEEVA
jgi:signal transduction histidine kinase/CheY-like chemotaxis protein